VRTWYSIYHPNKPYTGSEPAFPVLDADWVTDLERASAQITDELKQALAGGNQLPEYFNKDAHGGSGKWKATALWWWDVRFGKTQRIYPKTTAILASIPGLVSASFSKLEPGGHIVPHHGDTNAIWRCHLGLVVPCGLPECGFRVKNEQRPWHEGKLLAFCDAHEHEAWNNTESDRYILIIDVMRDEWMKRRRRVCSHVIASLFLQKVVSKLPFLRRTPAVVAFVMHKVAAFHAWWMVPVRNWLYRAR
jgi:aspartyl/asparaginyl beta-hydroxylase (cupin superfamily)